MNIKKPNRLNNIYRTIKCFNFNIRSIERISAKNVQLNFLLVINNLIVKFTNVLLGTKILSFDNIIYVISDMK